MKKFTNRLIVAVAAVCMLSLASCDKEDVVFLQDLGAWEVCLPANPNYGNTVFMDTLSQSEIQAAFAAAGAEYDHDRVKNLKLKQVAAQITTNAVSTNFNTVASFSLYAKAPGTTGEGTQIAYIDNIGTDATQVSMLLNGTELKELLHEDFIVLTLTVTTKQGGNDALCFKLINGQMEYKLSAE